MPAQVVVHLDLGDVMVIGGQSGRGPQGVGRQTITGALAGFPVQPDVGHLVEPLLHLMVHIGGIGEGAKHFCVPQ